MEVVNKGGKMFSIQNGRGFFMIVLELWDVRDFIKKVYNNKFKLKI